MRTDRSRGAPAGARVLVAGLGNVCFGDDGFGVAVADRVARMELPPAARVVSFGVRGLELLRALDGKLELLVALEASPRGGSPGTLYVMEALDGARSGSIELPLALAAARARGIAPRVCVVACEPADLGAHSGLSAAVHRAVDPAARIVERLVRRELAGPVVAPRHRG
ncbi:MAG TPA: hydrogenase maturation protease [Sandaracinaceae bacterium]